MKRRLFVVAAAAAIALPVAAQQPITLHGAVQFNDDHAFNRALEKFQELTVKYYGKPINFVLHKNSELGLEKDYFAYMNQGISVDYAHRVAGAHVDVLEGGAVHRRAVPVPRPRPLEQGARRRHAEADRRRGGAKGDVMLIGFAGGGTRNIFANKPVRNLAEMKGLKVRVQGAPIWSKTFSAIGMSPTVIAYDEIYNAIQNGVIQRRRERGGGRRGDEVLRSRPEPQHDAARDHDPADLLLRQDVQEAAARPAGRDPQGRQGSRHLRPPDRVERGRSRSSTRWRRPASSRGSRSPTARR